MGAAGSVDQGPRFQGSGVKRCGFDVQGRKSRV